MTLAGRKKNRMHVFLDTNAVRATGIDGPAFQALADYLQKRRSRLLLSSVVIEELLAHYRRDLQKLEHDLRTAHQNLAKLVPSSPNTPPAVDTEHGVSEYRGRLLNAAQEIQVVENEPEDLMEMVRRLAGHVPPATKGREARDVLIWLALSRVARLGPVAFISGDKGAFYQNDNLHPRLAEELGDARNNLTVYQDLRAFLKSHHEHISFIDSEWVDTQMGTPVVLSAIQRFIDNHPRIFEESILELGDPTGYISLVQIVQYKVEDLFVSERATDGLFVAATVWAELELEVEFEEMKKETRLTVRSFEAFYDYLYPCVSIQLELAVADGEVRGTEVSCMKLA